MRKLMLASLVLVASSAFAGEKPADLIAYLTKQMGGEEIHLKGRTDIMTDCAIDFVVGGNSLRATYSDVEGTSRNIRGLFEVNPKTKVKNLDSKRQVATVDNEYIENLGNGQTRKSIYRARMEIEADARGNLTFVNIGWNYDRGEPFMYGCSIQ